MSLFTVAILACCLFAVEAVATRFNGRVPEGQVGWSLYRIWYEAERVHESLGYQTPHQQFFK